MERRINLVIISSATPLLFLAISVLWTCSEAATTTTQEIVDGFEVMPDRSVSSFQSVLTDPTGNFSFGFLRINKTQLAVVVLHVASSEPLWVANPSHLARWSDRTQLFFNGSLVISDPHTKVFWSTATQGDRVVLLSDSNLQVQKLDGSSRTVVWQSFDFPTSALVENQNFTAAMTLVSSNGLYTMRLGDNFIGLYSKFKRNSHQIYWKHKAMEAKASIVEGQGPIYARVNSDGYLGMYQKGSTPVDVQPFNSFERPLNGLLILRLEPDGDLKGYYWDGSNWVLDYQAITDSCELPSACGSYGLCKHGSGCSCLDNQTDFQSGECLESGSGDFCGEYAKIDFRVLRRKGMELPFKELMGYKIAPTLEDCEGSCERNCSCWGAVYNNASGFCYELDYPIQTLVGVGDETKLGYFKVRKGPLKNKMEAGLAIGIGVLGGVAAILIGAIGFGSYMFCGRKRWVNRMMEEETGLSPGPYKDLGSASFRSIEMSNRG